MSQLFQIKICGITRPEDALVAFHSGADAVGLNFYPGSKRFVTLESASAIADVLRTEEQRLGRSIVKVGVFVNSELGELSRISDVVPLDAIQLHGDEAPSLAMAIKRTFPQSPHVIRALRIELSRESVDPSLRSEMENWVDAGATQLLLDAFTGDEYGGTGHTLDWDAISSLRERFEETFLDQADLTLAGGLTPQNVADAIERSGFRSVDVASGVESRPAEKDAEKVSNFVKSAAAAFARQSGPTQN